MRPALSAAALAALLAGCGPDPFPGGLPPADGGGGGGLVTAPHFSEIEANLLVPRCATSSCHSGNPPPTAPGSFDAGRAYDELVGRPSLQLPSMNLVEPGAPDLSYFVLKLRGTAGITGALMPIGDAALDEVDIEAIEAWIASGALND